MRNYYISLTFSIFLNIFITLFCVLLSSADKLSSNIRISGSDIIALAIDSLCFCPPDKLIPFSPTFVLTPSVNVRISFLRSEIAKLKSSLSSIFLLNKMFSFIVSLKI